VPLPPPKPPSKPGAASRPGLAKAPPSNEDAIAKAKREKDELEKDAQSVEEELEALKARYDQYFLGIERREPNRWREELKKKVMRLKGAFTRNTGLKFRIQSLHARFISYERLWLRSAREKEEGTYRRDLFKARLRSKHGEPAPPEPTAPPPAAAAARPEPKKPEPPAPLIQKPAPAPAAGPVARDPAARPAAAAAPAKPPPAKPAPAAPAAAPAPGGASTMSEPQMRALYNAYLAAKITCREDVSKLTYEAVAKTVSKQIPELMTRFKAKTVEFKVEVKDGKAVLKAIPKI
jgi:hypothetical protein